MSARRPLSPVGGRAAGYPRLGAAWRALAGAPLVLASAGALADVTPPPSSGQAPHPAAVRPATPVVADNSMKPPENPSPPPSPAPKPPPPHRKLMGKVACPQPPDPPPPKAVTPKAKPPEFPRPRGDIARARRPEAPWLLLARATPGEGTHTIHPHGPDEPCQVIDAPEEDA